MELFGRERLDVHFLQGPAVDFVPCLSTFPQRIVRSREPNDDAIAVADTARSAHGQTPARCALPECGLLRRDCTLSSSVVRWRRGVQGSGGFFCTRWPLQSYAIVAPVQARTCRDR